MKNAYSLVELLLVIMIISVLSLLSMQIFSPRAEKYNKLYITAYDTLVQATGNAYLDWAPDCACVLPNAEDEDASGEKITVIDDLGDYCWTEECWKGYIERKLEPNTVGGIVDFPREYPNYLFGRETGGEFDGTETDIEFCRLITKHLNTIEKDNECSSFISGIQPSANRNSGQNFLHMFCALTQSATGGAGECAGTQGGIIPSFITANGQRFYISSIVTANIPCAGKSCLSDFNDQTTNEAKARKERMQFRFIAVDLNGNKPPNTQLHQGSIRPDIVLFALKADGTVVPLGRPEVDQAYLSMHVEYPELKNEIVDGVYVQNTQKKSSSSSMAISKMNAWGFSMSKDTGNLNVGSLKWPYMEQPLILSEPLSYSGFFYELALKCDSTLGCTGSNFSGLNGENKGAVHADPLLVNLVKQFIYLYENEPTMIHNEVAQGIDTDLGPHEGRLTSLTMDCAYDKGCVCDIAAAKCKVNYHK